MCLKVAEKLDDIAAAIGTGFSATDSDDGITFAGGRKASNFTER